jgi:hypothetical protein
MHNLSFLTGSIRAKFHIAAMRSERCYALFSAVKNA